MEHSFSADAIKTQITNLRADRDRIDQAINALESALHSIENVNSSQVQLRFDSDISLHDAVLKACLDMIDAITRGRVLNAIERAYPLMKPKDSSIAAALLNLSKGEHALLKVAIAGRGSAPSVYSTEGDVSIRLSSEEAEALMDETVVKGSGGWQSLWIILQSHYDAATGMIKLVPSIRARLYQYYHQYGTGGWQTRAKKVFKRELPHLFLAQ